MVMDVQVGVSSAAHDWNWSRGTSPAASSSSSTCHRKTSDSDVLSPSSRSHRSSLSGSRPASGGSSGSGGSGGGLTKKVSFADDLGMLLEQIQFFYESSDTPPNLSPRVLRRYASAESLLAVPPKSSWELTAMQSRSKMRLSASMPLLQQPDNGLVAIPRLVPNFAMPSADRPSYLERIERACVSLESVRVLPVESPPPGGAVSGSPPVIDRLVGSVAVRNLAFEKSVTARCTFDGWASYFNVRAVYARSERVARPSGAIEFDVFDFSVNLPVRWRTVRGDRPRVELAIRYDVAGQTFWDNNDGQNYELVGTSNTSPTRSRLRYDDYVAPCWTEFSGWSNVDTSCPYW